MTQAVLPDGRILEFPDGTSPEVIQGAVKRMLGVAEDVAVPEGFAPTPDPILPSTDAAPQPQQPPLPEDAGLGERIGRRMEQRGTELDAIREALATGEQTLPESVGQVVGKTLVGGALDIGGELFASGLDVAGDVVSAVTPDVIEGPIVEGSTEALEWALESDIGQLGIEAARSGAKAYDEFKTEHPRAARNIESVLNVGLIAAPLTSALRVGSKVPKFTKKALAGAPDSEALFKQATKKFNEAKQSGSVLDADIFVDFMSAFERSFSKQIDPSLHPRLTGTLNLLERRIGEDLSVDDLMLIRRNISAVGKSLDPDERRLGMNLLDGFDDFVEKMPGNKDWVDARKIYARGIKSELMEDAILQAGNAASGVENGLRIEFRKLLNNKRKARRFSKSERAAMEKVVQGDFTTNTLRKLGGLSFGAGQQRTPLTALAGLAVGGEIAGGAGALGVLGVGRVSLGLAEKRTRRAADIARALAAGVEPKIPARLAPTLKRGAAVGAIAGAEGPE